ncbi:MAG: hypothetical protein U5K43_13435 [Halofilum sp. (in: g-proteobacteria)]|nr:hypothetical protein [Halofilum sp. (in: g-proteobacteria)]
MDRCQRARDRDVTPALLARALRQRAGLAVEALERARDPAGLQATARGGVRVRDDDVGARVDEVAVHRHDRVRGIQQGLRRPHPARRVHAARGQLLAGASIEQQAATLPELRQSCRHAFTSSSS